MRNQTHTWSHLQIKAVTGNETKIFAWNVAKNNKKLSYRLETGRQQRISL